MDIERLPLILASASPRRKQLLTDAGYKFTVVVSQIDESVFLTENIAPAEYAKQLALAKANDVAEKCPDSIIIGADTVVDFEGQIIGKPRDARHAEEITRMLFSKPHKVITGLALICKSRNLQIVEAETTVVYPKKLTDAQIAGHIKSGIWCDKAGAYAIKENDDPFVDHIEGSMTNVMGMPMELFKSICPVR
ncbi:MAG: nucleoside triphosphate pyrophosphatase [Sedimentisphaerales bacterium]